MSKKCPSSEAEARWRANYRYRRIRARAIDEVAIGDPLGLVEHMRRTGTLAAVGLARAVTTRRRRPEVR